MKLLGISRSPKEGKKWRATFQTDEGRQRHTDFGAAGMQDLTQHGDEERARRYRLRHQKDLNTQDPTRAGYLSYYILWSTPNMTNNIRAYKNRFGL